MSEDLISGAIYTEFDETKGPNPVNWEPSDLADHIQKLISFKTLPMLAGEEHIVPEDLVIIPFPSLNSKALVRFVGWKDDSRRGGIGIGSVSLLFKEFDDLIFYKYKEDLQPIYDEFVDKLVDLKKLHDNEDKLKIEFKTFYEIVIDTQNKLRQLELGSKESKEFPEDDEEIEVFDYKFKLVVVGDPSVGKTSTILRFTDNAFTRTYIPTIGVNITKKSVKINEKTVRLLLWDIAGQAKFDIMRKHFYRGAEGAFLIFDLTHRPTFENIENWHVDIKKILDTEIIGFVIGNKNDLIKERSISNEEAESLAKNLRLEYFETSALTGDNINNSFKSIAETLVKNLKGGDS